MKHTDAQQKQSQYSLRRQNWGLPWKTSELMNHISQNDKLIQQSDAAFSHLFSSVGTWPNATQKSRQKPPDIDPTIF